MIQRLETPGFLEKLWKQYWIKKDLYGVFGLRPRLASHQTNQQSLPSAGSRGDRGTLTSLECILFLFLTFLLAL